MWLIKSLYKFRLFGLIKPTLEYYIDGYLVCKSFCGFTVLPFRFNRRSFDKLAFLDLGIFGDFNIPNDKSFSVDEFR